MARRNQDDFARLARSKELCGLAARAAEGDRDALGKLWESAAPYVLRGIRKNGIRISGESGEDKRYLVEMCQKGFLERLGRGVFSAAQNDFDLTGMFELAGAEATKYFARHRRQMREMDAMDEILSEDEEPAAAPRESEPERRKPQRTRSENLEQITLESLMGLAARNGSEFLSPTNIETVTAKAPRDRTPAEELLVEIMRTINAGTVFRGIPSEQVIARARLREKHGQGGGPHREQEEHMPREKPKPRRKPGPRKP